MNVKNMNEEKNEMKNRLMPIDHKSMVVDVMEILTNGLPIPRYQVRHGSDAGCSRDWTPDVLVTCEGVEYWLTELTSLEHDTLQLYIKTGLPGKWPSSGDYNADIVTNLVDAGYTVVVDDQSYSRRYGLPPK